MGITIDYEKGIKADDTATVRQSLVEAWQEVFSDENATINTEAESPAGQIIDSQAVLVTAKDSELVELMNQFDPRKADGIFQEALAAIYFLTRKTAQPTVVECVCTGLQGTTIPAGSMIQNDDGYKLTSVGAVTIPASGSVNVEFQTVDVGAIPIPANSCNKIITVIAGWDTVSNENAGVVGQLEESRTALETRRALSVAKNSHGSRLSLQGSIASIDGVLDCLVLENKSNTSVTMQGVSLISHSVAICVYGGTDEAIAEMIYNKLDAGCGTNGSTTVTYTSEDGVPNSYQIVRPAPTNLYVEVTINETTTTPATIEDDIKNAIVDDFNGLDVNSGNLRRGCGQTIYASSFSVALIKTAGVSDLVSIEIGRTAGTYTNSVVMDADEEPILTAENINVVMNPLS
jgi:uncharacterized phage protein gp47/JayE